MEPPFMAGGGELEPPYFIDRDEELAELTATLGTLSENKVVLGVRRVGKSCLLHNALKAIRANGILTGKLSCRGIGSLRSLGDELIIGTLRAYQDESLIRGWVRLRGHLARRKILEAVQAIEAIEFGAVQDAFRARIELHERSLSEEQYLRRAFRFIQTFTDADRPLVLALDEFQELDALQGDVFQFFKTAADETPHVRFIFSGSSLSLLEKVFLRPDSPLYLMAGRLFLQPLPAGIVRAFVQDRLRRVGITADASAAELVHELTGGIPFYVQKLGLITWIHALKDDRQTVTRHHVEAAFDGMLRELSAEFEVRLEHKYGPLQKDIIRALADGARRRSEIAIAVERPEGQLSHALRRLEESQEVLKPARGQYELADLVFQRWLASPE